MVGRGMQNGSPLSPECFRHFLTTSTTGKPVWKDFFKSKKECSQKVSEFIWNDPVTKGLTPSETVDDHLTHAAKQCSRGELKRKA